MFISDNMKKKAVKTLFIPAFILVLCIAITDTTFAKRGRGGDDGGSSGGTADTIHLTDEPGNWFRSETGGALGLGGTPLTIIDPGDKVDFKISNCCTNTRHTVTLVIKPEGSTTEIDQDSPQKGEISATFDVPGVYVILCKVHPYMTCVVAVRNHDATDPLDIPDVTSGSLPFIKHVVQLVNDLTGFGLPLTTPLPATTVLSVITTVAPMDNDHPLFGKTGLTPFFPAGHPLGTAPADGGLADLNGAFGPKWDILSAGDLSLSNPTTPGVGEVWIDAQFEHVPGQTDDKDVDKPGTIVVLDASDFTIEREINGLDVEDNMWNNPHNIWANDALDTIYNSNWFGKWINKIDRASGDIVDSITVGEAPTHIVTIPPSLGSEAGVLTIPLSAEDDIVKVEDTEDGLHIIDHFETGAEDSNPHGHWLNCGKGDRIVSPNVFNGMGVEGSISIIDTASGSIQAEFLGSADPFDSLVMPLAAGECHVNVDGTEINKAYVSDIVTGVLHVINTGGDVDGNDSGDPEIIGTIPVTIRPDGVVGGTVFDTLQVPIQTPVDPTGRFVATAVLSLTTVPRVLPNSGGVLSADHVAIIDAKEDEVVKWLPAPAGVHGINWGAKLGGGYYAYVTSQHANVLTVIDPDPNNDGSAGDAAVVGTILLANGDGSEVTDGTGGQGVKPIPIVHDGWIQPTVELEEDGEVSSEVAGWINALTDEQKNPEAH